MKKLIMLLAATMLVATTATATTHHHGVNDSQNAVNDSQNPIDDDKINAAVECGLCSWVEAPGDYVAGHPSNAAELAVEGSMEVVATSGAVAMCAFSTVPWALGKLFKTLFGGDAPACTLDNEYPGDSDELPGN